MLDHNAPTVPMPAIPPAPTFPQTNYQVVPEGVVITVALASTTQIVQFVPDETLNQINAKRLEMKKAQRDALTVVRTNTGH